MKAIILNGSYDGSKSAGTIGAVKRELADGLRGAGWNVEVVDLAEKKIESCPGCFGCWVKTPGICVQKDDGNDIIRSQVASDLSVYLTPIAFGGYSSEMKKIVDRYTMGSSLPYFKKFCGEIHHPKRYGHERAVAVVGILERPDEGITATFKDLVGRNFINWQPEHSALRIIDETLEPAKVKDEVKKLLTEVAS